MSVNKQTITVAGATGKSGGATVRALSASGKVNVRALVRDDSSDAAKALAALPNVTLVKGDYTDAGSLEAALKGADRAFLVCSPGAPTQSDHEIAFIKVAVKQGVKHVVRISTCKPLIHVDSKGVYAAAHARIEKFIEESKAPVTDLNPDWFMDNWAGNAAEAKGAGQITQPYGKHPKHGFIHSDDIGGYAAALLSIPEDQIGKHVGKRYTICGPEQVTFDEVWAALSKEVGYEIKQNDVSVEAFEGVLKSVGFPDVMALAFALTYGVQEEILEKHHPLPTGTDAPMAALYKPKVTVAQHIKNIAPLFKRA